MYYSAFCCNCISLSFHFLFSTVIAALPNANRLQMSPLQEPESSILAPRETKSRTIYTFSPSNSNSTTLPRCYTVIYIIIIRQPLCPVVGRRPQHAVSKLTCLMLSSTISCRSSICLGRLSTAWLVSLVVFSCHNGLQVVTREVHRSSLRRLICPAQDHFICLTVLC